MAALILKIETVQPNLKILDLVVQFVQTPDSGVIDCLFLCVVDINLM